MDHKNTGRRQRMIMNCFWDAGGSLTVPELQEVLEREHHVALSRSSLNTMVQTLVDKGFVELEKKTRYAYVYHITLTKQEFQMQELNHLKDEIFEGSLCEMMVGFAKQTATKEELEQVRKLLEELDK